MEIYTDFADWLDKHMEDDLPEDIVAFNFNLYEGSANTYDVELVGCGSYDEEDDGWVCDEVFDTRDDWFVIPRTNGVAQGEQGLSFASALVERYLREGKYAAELKNYTAVGIGLHEGDIEILHRAE